MLLSSPSAPSSHGSVAIEADGAFAVYSQGTHSGIQILPEAVDEGSPFAYAELDSTSGGTETTCNSPGPEMTKFPSRNVVRLIPISNYTNRAFLHMEVDFREPGQEFLVHTLDGTEGSMTMGEILRRHSHVIDSIAFDATNFPNPELPSAMVGTVNLPFAPRAVVSETYLYSAMSSSMPSFPVLKDISIASSRAISVASLLEFLHFCPMLKSIAINNSMRHMCVLPESVDDIAEPNLPHLGEVILDGLLTYSTEILLDKLLPSLNETTRVEVHLYHLSFPVLQHGPALQKLFSPVRHARLSFTLFSTDADPETELGTALITESELQNRKKESWYLLTCSDIASRVQLNWHWTPNPDLPLNLLHIGLVNPSFAKVRTLSLSLKNIRPSYYDLFAILQSFRGVSRVELLSTQSTTPPPDVPKPASYSDVEPTADAQSLLGLLSDEEADKHTGSEPSFSFLSQHRIFKVRAAWVLRKLLQLPVLFALQLTQVIHSPPSPSPPQISALPSSSFAANRAKAFAHLPTHMRELATIMNPPMLFAMEIAHEREGDPGTASPPPLTPNAQARVAARTQIPAHMRRVARVYYDPMWALMVRTPARWEP